MVVKSIGRRKASPTALVGALCAVGLQRPIVVRPATVWHSGMYHVNPRPNMACLINKRQPEGILVMLKSTALLDEPRLVGAKYLDESATIHLLTWDPPWARKGRPGEAARLRMHTQRCWRGCGDASTRGPSPPATRST